MNIERTLQAETPPRQSLPEPIRLSPPDWLPWRDLLGLGVIVAAVCAACIMWVDRPAALYLAGHRDAAWVGFFRSITIAGNSAFWYTPAVAGFLAALWLSRRAGNTAAGWEWRRRARGFMFVVVSMMMSGTAVNALKLTFGRYRPRFLFSDGIYDFQPFMLILRDSGFPSGHSQSILAAMLAAGFLWPRLRYACWGFAAVVAVSRFIITVHFVADVVAGAFVAVAVGWTLKRYYERNGLMLAW